jgi:hypothetical protein
MRTRRRLAGVVLSSLLGMVACSDDGGGAATASPDTAGAATALAQPVETTAPSVDSTERPVDTFEPPVTTTAPSGAVLFDGDDFYTVPEPLPAGEPGTLLRYEPIDVLGGWSNFGSCAVRGAPEQSRCDVRVPASDTTRLTVPQRPVTPRPRSRGRRR